MQSAVSCLMHRLRRAPVQTSAVPPAPCQPKASQSKAAHPRSAGGELHPRWRATCCRQAAPPVGSTQQRHGCCMCCMQPV